jgi:hypothetical protein
MNVGGNTGNAVGSIQSQATAPNGLHDSGHIHNPAVNLGSAGTEGGYLGSGSTGFSGGGAWNFGYGGTAYSTGTGWAVLVGDDETRPKNAYVNYCVRAQSTNYIIKY